MAKAKGRNARPAAKGSTGPAKTASRNVDNPDGRTGPARPSSKDAVAKAVSKPAAKDGSRPPRATGGAGTGAGSGSGEAKPAAAKKPAGPRPKPAPTKRTTPTPSARYTPPIPKSQKVSPLWVPVVMFAALGLGMVIIILNYVSVWPGSPSNVYLMIGLGLITVGFITATKYH